MIRRSSDGRSFFLMDCHFHMGASGLLRRFRGKAGSFLDEGLIGYLDHYGIDVAVGFPTADKTDYSENTWKIVQLAKQFPDRIIPFTRINPHYEQTAAASIAGYAAAGVRGIKFHPLWDGFPANDPTLVRPVIEEANRFGMVVIFHSGETWMSLPGLIYDLACDYKDTKFIVGHSGLYGFDTEAMALARRVDNMWLDTTEHWPAIRIRTIVDAVGKDRVVFGTDAPYINTAAEVEKLLRFTELSDEELERILGLNLADMLGHRPSAVPTTTIDYPIEQPFFA